MTIIEQIKDDIINCNELQYNYEIDGVSVTVLMDDEITILANYNKYDLFFSWIIGDWYNTVDEAVNELEQFIKDPLDYGFKNGNHTFTKFGDYYEDVKHTKEVFDGYDKNPKAFKEKLEVRNA